MSFTPPQTIDAGRPPKASPIPIPRLKGRSGRTDTKSRNSLACICCRKRKVKCDGGQPRCLTCVAMGQTCVYIQGRKNRLKRSVILPLLSGWYAVLTPDRATELNQDMIVFLQDLKSRVTTRDRQDIENLLDQVAYLAHTP